MCSTYALQWTPTIVSDARTNLGSEQVEAECLAQRVDIRKTMHGDKRKQRDDAQCGAECVAYLRAQVR